MVVRRLIRWELSLNRKMFGDRFVDWELSLNRKIFGDRFADWLTEIESASETEKTL